MGINFQMWSKIPKIGNFYLHKALMMDDVKQLSSNFSSPPPRSQIHPRDWGALPLEVRYEFWRMWIDFRGFNDGTFGLHLHLVLKTRDITQKQLAQEIGVSEAEVSRWVQGRKIKNGKEKRSHIPDDLDMVIKITDEVDCTLMEKHELIRAYALECLWLKGFWNE